MGCPWQLLSSCTLLLLLLALPMLWVSVPREDGDGEVRGAVRVAGPCL